MDRPEGPRAGDRGSGDAPRPGVLRRLGWITAAVAGVVVVIGAAASAQPVNTGPLSAQVQPDAAVAYARQCAGCHGDEGEGSVGPDIRTWPGDAAALSALIAEGAPGMPAFAPTATPEQIEALVVFVDELTGAAVYTANCAVCHGQSGEGAAGPALTTSVLDEAGLRTVIAAGAGGMPGFDDVLTEAQLDALVRRAAGYAAIGERIYSRQCAACHGDGGGGGTGPALVGASLDQDETGAIVASGFGGMPAFGPTLSGGEVDAVVAYVLRLAPGDPGSVATTTSTTTTTTTSTPTTTTGAPSTTVAAAEPPSGADVYAAHCGLCHGADTEGGVGPPLLGTELTTQALREAIEDGQGSMPGFGGFLSVGEIDALVEYIERVSGSSSTVPTGVGADVYAEQCAACHGEGGEGGIGPSLRATLLSGPELRAAIGRGNATMPAFSRSLSPDDLERVARYVESLAGATGGTGGTLQGGPAIYDQDCSACHGPQGEGGIGPRLQGIELTVNEIIARVYGGHTAGMPAFQGALDGRQVRDVAQYIATFPGDDGDGDGLGGIAIILLGVGGSAALAAAAWALLRFRRHRRSGSA